MDGEVVGYFLHFLLQLPSLGRIVFPVKLIGKPLDPTHGILSSVLWKKLSKRSENCSAVGYIPPAEPICAAAHVL